MRISTHIAALGLLWTSVFVSVLAACDDSSRASENPACESQVDCSWGYVCDASGRCVARPGQDAGMHSDSGASPDAGYSWNEWGTSVDVASVPASTEQAVCSVADVRLDDLTAYEEDWTPVDASAPSPLGDEWGRCGDDLETLAWRLTNCERLARDLEPLSCDLRLVWAGRDHASDMRDRAYFSHLSPDGETAFDRLDERQVPFVWAGENLAHYTDIGGAHASWMLSEAHRRNILNDRYSHVGVGVVPGNDGQIYATELFIRP
jgi:uncharacterized protein YkwD